MTRRHMQDRPIPRYSAAQSPLPGDRWNVFDRENGGRMVRNPKNKTIPYSWTRKQMEAFMEREQPYEAKA